jgi:prefoldin subunit 1
MSTKQSSANPTVDLELKQAFAELQLKLIDTNQKIKFTDMQIESLKRSMLHKEITNREMGVSLF